MGTVNIHFKISFTMQLLYIAVINVFLKPLTDSVFGNILYIQNM